MSAKSMPSQSKSPEPASPFRNALMATLALLLFPISLALATQGSIDDLPQVVLDALSVAVPNMTVTEVEYSEEDDGIEYEVHGIWETREVEALLNEQGDILEMQIGDPEDDNIGDLPSSTTSELNNLFDEPSINSFEWISAAGLDYFDIQATVNGHPTQIKITQEGQLLWVETPDFSIDPANGTAIPYSELPGAVIATIGNLAFDHALVFSVPDTLYLVEASSGKARITLLINVLGELISYQLDRDADGLADVLEPSFGTHFNQWDSDGDDYPDGFELSKKTNPLNSSSFPQILSVTSRNSEDVLEIQVETFSGADFLLEQCGDAAGNWQALGSCFSGDNSAHSILIPIVDELKRCFFRMNIIPVPDDPLSHVGDSAPASGEHCDLPTSLVGNAIDVTDEDGGSRSLCFKTASRGEVIEEDDGETQVTPFAYAFERIGDCEARVTLTFSTSDGFETEVFTLTFTSDSGGAYTSQEYENGQPEDPEEGGFSLTMN